MSLRTPVIEQSAARLLLACATWEISTARTARVRRVAAGVNWLEWLALVRVHRLVPHAKRQLDAAGVEVPPDVRVRLDVAAHKIAAVALKQAAQLAELQRDCFAAHIPLVAYKGPALALTAYGVLGARQSVDLDIVVRVGDVARARQTLLTAGYVSRYGMSEAQERVVQGSFGHYVFIRREDEVPVELHWRFARAIYPWTLPVDDVFARAHHLDIAGASILTCDPLDSVLLQCMHGARHEWETLEWLAALAGTLHRTKIDGTALLDRATRNRSRRAVLLAVLLLRDLLQSDAAPRELIAIAERDPNVRQLAAAVVARFTHEVETGPHSSRQFALRLMDGNGDRANYLLRTAFEPTLREWELLPLPDALLPFYYLIRPVRLLFRRRASRQKSDVESE